VGLCLEYNLKHLKKLHKLYSERMTAGPVVHAALTGINLIADRALNKYLKRMKRASRRTEAAELKIVILIVLQHRPHDCLMVSFKRVHVVIT
jgi:hypothetical protein